METFPSTITVSKVTISLCVKEKSCPILVWLATQLKVGLKMEE